MSSPLRGRPAEETGRWHCTLETRCSVLAERYAAPSGHIAMLGSLGAPEKALLRKWMLRG